LVLLGLDVFVKNSTDQLGYGNTKFLGFLRELLKLALG
jgi:hypothetical protein